MRIVVKVGTSTLAHPGGRLNIRHTEALVKVWSDIKNAGHELILVSSGATGLGVGKLQIPEAQRHHHQAGRRCRGPVRADVHLRPAVSQYNHTVAQMLLTGRTWTTENRLNNLAEHLERLLQLGALPIINENDPVATEEYSLGDNDTLAAMVASAPTPTCWCC